MTYFGKFFFSFILLAFSELLDSLRVSSNMKSFDHSLFKYYLFLFLSLGLSASQPLAVAAPPGSHDYSLPLGKVSIFYLHFPSLYMSWRLLLAFYPLVTFQNVGGQEREAPEVEEMWPQRRAEQQPRWCRVPESLCERTSLQVTSKGLTSLHNDPAFSRLGRILGENNKAKALPPIVTDWFKVSQ